MVLIPVDGGFSYRPAHGYSVANANPVRLPEGFPAISGIACARETFVLTDNDVIMATELGTPMHIGARNGTMVVLEMEEGRLQYEVLTGSLSSAQRSAADRKVRDANRRLAAAREG